MLYHTIIVQYSTLCLMSCTFCICFLFKLSSCHPMTLPSCCGKKSFYDSFLFVNKTSSDIELWPCTVYLFFFFVSVIVDICVFTSSPCLFCQDVLFTEWKFPSEHKNKTGWLYLFKNCLLSQCQIHPSSYHRGHLILTLGYLQNVFVSSECNI